MSWTNSKKTVLLIFSFLLLTTIGLAQSANPVTITVSGAEYDNPSLTGLKEYLKANSKVKGLKSTFNNSVATLSFTYYTTADELWDEIPADKKQTFKPTSIDSKTIKLQVIKSAPVAANDGKTNSKNCGCDYFPLCNFDKTRSFMGEVWKGLDNEGKITYYNCANGILKTKSELFDRKGKSLGFGTFTALKYNEPEGAKWEDKVEVNGFLYHFRHRILERGIRVSVNGIEYDDVIKVYGTVYLSQISGELTQPLMFLEKNTNYYVKNVGVFRSKDTKELSKNSNDYSNQYMNHPKFENITKNLWYDDYFAYAFLATGTVRKCSFNDKKALPIASEEWLGKWKLYDEGENIVIEINWEDEQWNNGTIKFFGKKADNIIYFLKKDDGGGMLSVEIPEGLKKELSIIK